MKIDFNQNFKGIAGPGAENLTLASVAVQALNATGKEPISLEEAVRRGSLALRVMDGGEHDVSIEELALIRRGLPLVYAPIVVAQAVAMTDAKTE